MERQRERKPWREIDRGRESSSSRRDSRDSDRRREDVSRDSALIREHRNALEALFSPKKEPVPEVEQVNKNTPRIVLPPAPTTDPRTSQRRQLLAKLLSATGPLAISKVADEFVAEGFTFPEDQEIYLQLLEHTSEGLVRDAMQGLSRMLAGQLPKRKPVLDQRLRRIEEHAEDSSTRDAASSLRRVLQGRGSSTPNPGPVR